MSCEVAGVFLITQGILSAQFDYDRSQKFDTTCKPVARADAEVRGCGFTGPRGGRVSFIQVSPKEAKPPFAGVIFQHGGGQSMTNYLSEALVLARVGVVSMIVDAPARGKGKISEVSALKLEAARDFDAETVIIERRVLDLLLQQPGVDSKRIAYVGHSYGGIAGGVLAGIEQRISTFVLTGAIPSYARHIEVNGAKDWQDMRRNMSAAEFTRTLELIHEVDPEHFLPAAKAPVFVQCARFDSDDNVRACPEVYRLLGGPKRLAWYDDDHAFTSLEALRDRLAWLETNLNLKGVAAEFRKLAEPRP